MLRTVRTKFRAVLAEGKVQTSQRVPTEEFHVRARFRLHCVRDSLRWRAL